MIPRFSRRNFLLSASAAGATLPLAGGPAAAQQPPAPRRLTISKTAAKPDKPNIILIIIDTLRRDHMGAYGNNWIHTPAMDQLARQSLRFTRAVPEAMPTIPARRSIHSGMRTFPFRDWHRRAGNGATVWGWQHIPDDQPTIAEQLQKAGYETLLVTDNPHEFTPGMNFSRGFGTVQWIRGQEGDTYQPYWVAPDYDLDHFLYRDVNGKDLTTKYGDNPMWRELRQYLSNTVGRRGEDDYFAPRVFTSAARTLEGYPGGAPFFLVVDSFDPHEPWDAPRRYADMYDDPGYDQPEPVTPRYGTSDYLTERQLQRMRALYSGEITMVDRWLGNFIERVDALGMLDGTAIVFVSDHGMALGEHGWVGKPSPTLWSEMTDTPLMIRHPNGTAAGKAHDYFASTHDIAPTILSIAGVEPKTKYDGADLTPLLDDGPATARDYFTSGLNEYVWASDRRFTLIALNDGSKPELYDVMDDPGQTKDIAADSPDQVARMFDLVLKDAGGAPLPQYPPI